MVSVTYKNKTYTLQNDESVLNCLLRNGLKVPYSCAKGLCQTCVMKLEKGNIHENSQITLSNNQQLQNMFLACQCIPTEDLHVSSPKTSEITYKAEVLSKAKLSDTVLLLTIKPLTKLPFYPGQFINIITENGSLSRSYSIANINNEDGLLELHIRKIDNGKMSNWVHNELVKGNIINITKPIGECFYNPLTPKNSPLLLAGTGTGLAPLEGVILDALKNKHTGDIKLFHGALNIDGLYHVDFLTNLANNNPNFSYAPCIVNNNCNDKDYCIGNLDDLIKNKIKNTDLNETKAYFCGAPDMVNNLKTIAFMAGVSSKNIFSDPFLISQ